MSADVNILVDGRPVAVPPGTNMVDAANRLGIEVPIFCHHPRLAPVGMCRMCLVEVGTPRRDRATGALVLGEDGEPVIDFAPKPVPGCTTFAVEGMQVRTTSPVVADAREGILEFLLTSHPLDCPVCDKGGECPLQNLTMRYGPGRTRFPWTSKYHFPKPVPVGPLIALDRERCVLCARCIRFQDEIAADPVLDFENRGRGMEIVSVSDPPFASYFSGNTTDVCPVGALTTVDFRFEARAWEVVPRGGICVHCPVGCNLTYDVRGGAIRRVMPRVNDDVNEIWLCDKGRFAHHFASSPDRLTQPLVRRNGALAPATWDEALQAVHDGLQAVIAEHGADAVGGIAGDHLPNEDAYLFGRFIRGIVGTNNVDHRPGGVTSDVVARLGPGPDTRLSALGRGSTVLVVGLDVEEEAPVLYLALHKAVRHGARIVLAGGRGQKLDADGVALRWSNGGEAGLLAQLHADARRARADESSQTAEGGAGQAPSAESSAGQAAWPEGGPGQAPWSDGGAGQAAWSEAVAAMAGAERLLVVFGCEAVRLGLEEILAELVSELGTPGETDSGLVAVGAHANSQGVADMGLTPGWLPGYGSVADAGDRARVGAVWPSTPPDRPGLGAREMLGGGVRALLIAATDPAGDDPAMAAKLEHLDFLAVQELFLTETALRADVVLPAQSAPERSGTFTSMLRRVQRFHPAALPVGEAREDWRILRDLGELFGAPEPYRSAADVFDEVARVAPPYAGLSYTVLGPEPVAAPGTVMLPFAPQTAAREVQYQGTAYDNHWGVGRVWTMPGAPTQTAAHDEAAGPTQTAAPPDKAATPTQTAASPAEAGALTLMTAPRLYDRGTLLSASPGIAPLVEDASAEVNHAEAARLGLSDGQAIRVSAAGETLEAVLRVRATVPDGVVVLPAVTTMAARMGEVGAGAPATLEPLS